MTSTEQTAPAELTPAEKEKRSNALREAYSEATATLREKYRKEFDDLHVAAAKKRGIDYKPKPSPEQKAEEELRRILAEHPSLREKIAPAAPEAPATPEAEQPAATSAPADEDPALVD